MKKYVIVLVVIIVAFAGAWYFRGSNSSSESDIKCFESPKYFAVQRDVGSSVGSDIVIKYKTNPDQKIACKYSVSDGDFEIRNVVAEYFEFFTDNFAVLDSGTGPDGRHVIIYSLSTKSKIFDEEYSRPLVAEGDVISYWISTGTAPTSQNCPDLQKYTDGGLGAVIERPVDVDLTTMSKTYGAEMRCSARQ